jgi:hypothetical protein
VAICTLHMMDGAVSHLEEILMATLGKPSCNWSQLQRLGLSKPYSHRTWSILNPTNFYKADGVHYDTACTYKTQMATLENVGDM